MHYYRFESCSDYKQSNPYTMKKFLFNLQWWFDYHVIYFTYNTYKINRYHNYMIKKYGEKYTDLFTGNNNPK